MSSKEHALREIANQVRYWLEWNKESREKEGLQVNGDTAIISLPTPYWPSRSQFENWITCITDAADRLEMSSSEITSKEGVCGWKQDQDYDDANLYKMGCGSMFSLANDESLEANDFHFCHNCGKKIKMFEDES